MYLKLWSSINNMSILFMEKHVNMHRTFVLNLFISGNVSKVIRGKFSHFPCWSNTYHQCCIFVLLGISSYLVSYSCISLVQDLKAKMLTVLLRMMKTSDNNPVNEERKQKDIDVLEYHDNANTLRKTYLLNI